VLNFIVFRLEGSGTYNSWFVNIDGASGGDGSSGTLLVQADLGTSATAGTSGTTGTSGSSGTSGTTGTSGSSGTSGTSATDGTGGTSGTSGSSGTSGTTGTSGTSATSGTSGTSATSGTTGTSGTSGTNGTGGTSGTSGSSATSGTSGTSGSSGTTPVNQITGSGTTNYLPKFTGASTIGDSQIFDNGTFVGIGTSTSFAGGPRLYVSKTTSSEEIFRIDGQGGAGCFIVANTASGTATSVFSGNFGIGTINPQRILTIYDTNSATLYQTPTSGTTANSGFYVGQTGNVSYLYNYNNFPIVLATNSVESVRLFETSQNVHIGPTPLSDNGARLQVSGAATFSSSVTATSFNLGNGQFLRLTRNSGALQYDALGIVAGTDNTRLISTGDFDIVSGALVSQFKIASTGAATFSSRVTAQGFQMNGTGGYGVLARADGINSAANGAYIGFVNNDFNRYFISQLDTNNDINYYYFNGSSWSSSLMKFSNTGAATFSSSVTATGFSVNNSGFRGGIYPYLSVAGSGSDNSLTLFSEGGANQGNIYFCPNGSSTKLMTITSSGNVLIGTATDASGKLQVLGADNAIISQIKSASGMLQIYPYFSAYGGPIIQAVDGGAVGYVPLRIEASSTTFSSSVTAINYVSNTGSTNTPSYVLNRGSSFFDGVISWTDNASPRWKVGTFGTGSGDLRFYSANTGGYALTLNYASGAATFSSGIATNGYTASTSYAALFNGNVGIGTASPAYPLDIQSTSGALGISLRGRPSDDISLFTFFNNVANTQLAKFTAASTYFSTDVGGSERMRIHQTTNGGYFKASNNGVYQNAGSTGSYHEINQSLDNTESLVVSSNGNSSPYGMSVWFPNADPNNATNWSYAAFTGTNPFITIYKIFSNGTVAARSDARWKKNIETTRNGYIDDLCKLRVVKYNWYNHEDDAPKELGLIAQEVEEVFPNLINIEPVIAKREVEQEDGTIIEEEFEDGVSRSVKVSVLPIMLLKAIQEQQEQIKELQVQIDKLKNS
jgi:hypothetical protein